MCTREDIRELCVRSKVQQQLHAGGYESIFVSHKLCVLFWLYCHTVRDLHVFGIATLLNPIICRPKNKELQINLMRMFISSNYIPITLQGKMSEACNIAMFILI